MKTQTFPSTYEALTALARWVAADTRPRGDLFAVMDSHDPAAVHAALGTREQFRSHPTMRAALDLAANLADDSGEDVDARLVMIDDRHSATCSLSMAAAAAEALAAEEEVHHGG